MAHNFWGKLVADLRHERGVTQRVLASKLKINRNTLRRIEKGESSATIPFMEIVLDHFGYDLEAVSRDGFTYKVKPQKPQDPIERLMQINLTMLGPQID